MRTREPHTKIHRRLEWAGACALGISALIAVVSVPDLARVNPLACVLLAVVVPTLDWAAHTLGRWSKEEREQLLETAQAGPLPHSFDAIQAMVRRACAALGVNGAPRIRFREGLGPLAAIEYRWPTTLVFDTVALTHLTRDQLEGLIHHEIAHLASARHPWLAHRALTAWATAAILLGVAQACLAVGLGAWTIFVYLAVAPLLYVARLAMYPIGCRERELRADYLAARAVGRLPVINMLLRSTTLVDAHHELLRRLLFELMRDADLPFGDLWESRLERLPPPTASYAEFRAAIHAIVREGVRDLDLSRPLEGARRSNVESELRYWTYWHLWRYVDWRDHDTRPDGVIDAGELQHLVDALAAQPEAELGHNPGEQRVPLDLVRLRTHPTTRQRVLSLVEARLAD